MTTPIRKKLIEVALPLDSINAASAKEKSIRFGHPSTLHLWWARRPLAACRAVLFGQLVDDPSAWPDQYPTAEAQDRERQRLFGLITDLVKWENSNNETIVHAARVEIARSLARNRKAEGTANGQDEAVLRVPPSYGADGRYRELSKADVAAVNRYLAEVAPPVHDPFAGGGSIPLEAQRLGLRAIATDLNPVAVLINKALIEIPPKFAGMPPVNPESRKTAHLKTWKGAQGLAEDVRYYGKWMRDEAFKRIGHLYPQVDLPKEHGGGKATVIAWLWARTVASPNPVCGGTHVPLVASFWLSKKVGKEAWIEPVVDRTAGTWRFEVRTGKPKEPNAVDAGTKTGRGDFRCVLSGDPVPAEYIRKEGQAGRLKDRLMAIVAEGDRSRVYLPPTEEQERLARVPIPDGAPDTDLPEQALGFRVQNYGMRKHRDLFTPRQITALVTFSDLVGEARKRVVADAQRAAMVSGEELEFGGIESGSYSDAVAVYLGVSVSKLSDAQSSLCRWKSSMNQVIATFGRQALPMVWDFAESNPFAGMAGDPGTTLHNMMRILDGGTLPSIAAKVSRNSSQNESTFSEGICVSTDPPYYDNVPYADLSDYFYIWLRYSLRSVVPEVFSTLLTPKNEELIAEPSRHNGSRDSARMFFELGMSNTFRRIWSCHDEVPMSVYYAFKQSETEDDEGEDATTSSTGWETMLTSLTAAQFSVVGTWPLRTELGNRMRSMDSNALASSIVLVCRKRPDDAPTIDRTTFRRLLRQELPAALRHLQKGNIAPVDVAQASIGPGMAIFSRHSKVLEADGTAMSVRTALQLINQALDEYLTEQEGEYDADTRFALTWFETRAFEAGAFGEAETLAKARNVAVSGVAEAGILHSAGGKVRLLKRDELPDDWDPAKDKRPTVWEATQHLIKRLETRGETGAADLMAALGAKAAPARDLAYRLYTTCERKKWAEEARAYNGLVVSWPEIEKLASQQPTATKAAKPQMDLNL